MKVGDLVKMRTDNLEEGDLKKRFEESSCGIVIGFEPRGWQRDRDPDCDVWNDAVVYWPGFGVGHNMRAMLEVISEGH